MRKPGGLTRLLPDGRAGTAAAGEIKPVPGRGARDGRDARCRWGDCVVEETR